MSSSTSTEAVSFRFYAQLRMGALKKAGAGVEAATPTDGVGPFNAIFRFLILTGQRREEVAGMTWAVASWKSLRGARTIFEVAEVWRSGANCMVLHPDCHDDPVEFTTCTGFSRTISEGSRTPIAAQPGKRG
jgi:hypothetical protein